MNNDLANKARARRVEALDALSGLRESGSTRSRTSRVPAHSPVFASVRSNTFGGHTL